jgi:predicted  nucleic acid-binding Zn-ribbon protein
MGDAGGELTWEDHVKEVHRLRMLEGQIREQKKELRKVVKKIKTAEKQYKAEKAEGILATYLELEFKKEEIETKIQALEVDLTPLIISARKAEIEEDDAEFFSLLK